MRLEEGSLILIKIESDSEYEFEGETSTGFALSLYTSLSSILLLPLSILIDLLPTYSNINQYYNLSLAQIAT